MSFISFKRVNKIYDNGNRAVKDFSLDIDEGEFVVLVGPSGCGKSTVLRMIAGLEEISTGVLTFNDSVINEVKPQQRNIAMVFQNYALYPHLTVFENMGFGLKMAKVDKEEIKKRVNEAAEILGISELLSRKPGQLSGGQKQRVALGRAIVRKPKIFLFDEPLSNVDAKIRQQMRSEITKLHQRLGTTFVYVTHDQVEAMAMADKIVVMNKGEIQQVGTPFQIFQEPKNVFTATFLGSPSMDILPCKLNKKKDKLSLTLFSKNLELESYKESELIDKSCIGQDILLGIRPDNVKLVKTGGDFKGVVSFVENFGSQYEVGLMVKGADKPFVVTSPTPFALGESIEAKIDPKTIHLFSATNKKKILGVPDNIFLSGFKAKETKPSIILKGQGQSLDIPEDGRSVYPLSSLSDITIGFSSSSIKLKKSENDLKIDFKLLHVQDLVREKGIYGITPDGQFIAFCLPNEEAKGLKGAFPVYVPIKGIELYDHFGGNMLLSKYPLFDNELGFEKTKGGIKILSQILPIKVNEEEKTISFPLDGAKIVYKKKMLQHLSKCLVLDNQSLGDKSLVFLKSKKGEFMNFMIDGQFDRHDNPFVYVSLLAEKAIIKA